MNLSEAFEIENAKQNLMNETRRIQENCNLSACEMSGVITFVLSEIRLDEKKEIINATNELLKKKEEELEKAKEEAKKVLKTEQEEITDE